MSEPFVFDPRHPACKLPFGAAPCGSSVSFWCRPLQREQFSHCAIVLYQEASGQTEELELSCEGPEAERIRFARTLSLPETPGLIWYHFRFWREDGTGCDLDSTGYRSDGQTENWQLTVYQPDAVPAWFGSGVTYQIFPDSFCRLPEDPAETAGLVGDRWVHTHWEEPRQWAPDPDGEVRCRDFYGGTLRGITARLPFLSDLGVTTLYLNPIFESASNHRYNTADYHRIDPMLGTEEDFCTLCRQAHALGMRVLLDGVFNHTGSQSLYFNADGFYPTVGAAQSLDSPYQDWYSFHPWPEDYDAWWGIRTLPAVREDSESYQQFLFGAEDAVVRHWLHAGADGWRLDVADELPDNFIRRLRSAVSETKPDALLLGEVWEDASNKIAYSQRRTYLLGGALHGVMNYPFRTALIAYLTGGDAGAFCAAMETLRENYPPSAYSSAMNFLGTHDTPRILTVLGAERVPETKAERAAYRLSPQERERGEALVKLAAAILFCFPGSPTVYYGDELGMEGFEDPMNRAAYPRSPENAPLLPWFRTLGQLRRRRPSLQQGGIRYLWAEGPLLAFLRETEAESTLCAVNAGDVPRTLTLPWPGDAPRDLVTGAACFLEGGSLSLALPPRAVLLLG